MITKPNHIWPLLTDDQWIKVKLNKILGGSGAEEFDIGRFRKEKQCKRLSLNTVRNQRHNPGYGNCSSSCFHQISRRNRQIDLSQQSS